MSKAGMAVAAAWCLGAAPLAAQNNSSPTAPPPEDTQIGPGELSNFSLNGTVTRPAARPPAAQPASPPTTAREPDRPTSGSRAAEPTASAPTVARPDPADSDLFRRPPTLPDASAVNGVTAAPPTVSDQSGTKPPPLASDGFSLLPWIVALLAITGAGVMYFGRQRREQRYAGQPAIDILRPDPPEPRAAAAPPTTPVSAGARRPLPTTLMPKQSTPSPVEPRADPVIPGGIVSTSLRPWIEVELSPDRALLDEAGVAIAFEVTLFNAGSAAARDVIIEARLLNAGAQQDVELSAFFTAEASAGDPIPQIAPYARIPLRSAVRLTRAEVREYEIEGRKLFVPLVAINVRYRWSSGVGQSAAGFLVGQGAEGQEKLAPLRLDRGARSWKGLGARRYEKGLRS